VFFVCSKLLRKENCKLQKNVMKMKNGFGSDIPPGFWDPPSLQAVNE
jgi:hypothetical protein